MTRKMSSELNAKELAVFLVFKKSGKDEAVKIEDVAGLAFAKKGTKAKTKGNSWVRNSLRKLRRLHLVRKVKKGAYIWSGKDLKKPEAKAEAKAA